MKELGGSAQAALDATAEACFELVSDVERYPSWNPELIRRIEVLAVHSGRPTRVRATVHLAAGPVTRDFDLVMDVDYSGRDAVSLSRVPHETGDPERFEVVWRIRDGTRASLAIELRAQLEVPRLLPLGGVGDRIAQGFLEAAKRELERSRPNASASSS